MCSRTSGWICALAASIAARCGLRRLPQRLRVGRAGVQQRLHDRGDEIAAGERVGVDRVAHEIGLHRGIDDLGELAAAQQGAALRPDLGASSRAISSSRAIASRSSIDDRDIGRHRRRRRQHDPARRAAFAAAGCGAVDRRPRRAEAGSARRTSRRQLGDPGVEAAILRSAGVRTVLPSARTQRSCVSSASRPAPARVVISCSSLAHDRAARRGDRQRLAGIGRRAGRFRRRRTGWRRASCRPPFRTRPCRPSRARRVAPASTSSSRVCGACSRISVCSRIVSRNPARLRSHNEDDAAGRAPARRAGSASRQRGRSTTTQANLRRNS